MVKKDLSFSHFLWLLSISIISKNTKKNPLNFAKIRMQRFKLIWFMNFLWKQLRWAVYKIVFENVYSHQNIFHIYSWISSNNQTLLVPRSEESKLKTRKKTGCLWKGWDVWRALMNQLYQRMEWTSPLRYKPFLSKLLGFNWNRTLIIFLHKT